MKIYVHVREKVIVVQCGSGLQKIRWLGDVGVARYDSSNGADLGIPKGLKRDSGEILDLNDIIINKLQPNEHIWVMLKDDE